MDDDPPLGTGSDAVLLDEGDHVRGRKDRH